MHQQLPSCYTALQSERASLDRRAAKTWAERSALLTTDRRRSPKTLVMAVAIGLVGLGGTVATLAQELPGLPDRLVAKRPAEGGQETMPAHPWDGRSW